MRPAFSLALVLALPMDNAFSQSVNPSLQEVEVTGNIEKNDTSEAPALGSTIKTSGDTLETKKIQSLSELSQQVPGFYGFGSTPRLAGFSIRGLGNNQFNDGLDSSVGLYVDGVYLARQSYSAFGLYDLDTVDVYRGPQGSRYGLDSTAGEVQIQSRQPSHTRESNITLGLGNQGYRELSAASTGSLIEGELAGRISVFKQQRDGFLFNQFDGTLLNDQNRFGVRGQLLWTPSDELVIRFIGEYGELDQQCCAIALFGPVSRTIQASDEYMGYNRPGTNPADRVTDNNIQPLSKLTKESAAVVAEWGPPGRHKFVSITGLNRLAYNPTRNDDGTSMNLLEGSTTSESQQISQELRWHTDFKRLKTTVGVFALNQKLRGEEVGILGDEIALWALGGALRQQVPTLNRQNSGFLVNALLPPDALNGLRLSTPYSQSSNTLSAFSTADWRINAITTATAGIRYTESKRRGSISRSRSGGNLQSSPLAFTNTLTTVGNLIGQDLSAVTYDGLIDMLVGESFDRTDSRKDHGTSGQLALHRQLTKTLSGHASLTRGYKSGGLNLAGLSPSVRAQFDPEIADSFQVGLKRIEPTGRSLSSLTLYNTRVKNFQALTYEENMGLIPNPRQNNVLNIPEVRLQGVELEMAREVTRRLTVGAGVAYNRAISTEFANAPNEDTRKNDKNLSGKQLYNAPRWSGFVSLEQKLPNQGELQPYVGLDHTFRSATFGAVDQSRNSFIDAYQLTNLRLGVRNLKQKWHAQAWVKNLFDEDYKAAVSALYSLGEYGGYAGDPRTFGVSLDLSY
ncbi:TonB-dependent receptor [Limnobacter sp.]|uniref:TonB-dependent receptor n=1 Tax=Limnobacter sp. TaxID=2003368 RepID=UPI000156C866|nr:TonB-dependent receptor plug domain-containing protein [Limnobacter sp.]EDM83196.1 putative TonB-dependent receptor [Limnobacter sp. MED105]